jgi:hypothetical protein
VIWPSCIRTMSPERHTLLIVSVWLRQEGQEEIKLWVKAQRQPNMELPNKARDADDKESSSQVGSLQQSVNLRFGATAWVVLTGRWSCRLCRQRVVVLHRGTMWRRAWTTRCSCT